MVRIWNNFLIAGLRTDKICYHKEHGRFPHAGIVPIHILFMDFHTLDKQKKRPLRLLDTDLQDLYQCIEFLQARRPKN